MEELTREEAEERTQHAGIRLGTCRFCGQRRTVRYAGGYAQEELDKIATDECNCDGAKATMTVNTKGAVKVKLSETIITTLKDAVELEQVKDE